MIVLLLLTLALAGCATAPRCRPACDVSQYCDWQRSCDGFTGRCDSTGEAECRWKPERK